MGTVYLAEDTHLGRRVAIKFPSVGSDSHDYRARFLREARAVSELNHPAIATLFDYGESDEGRPFLVMELAKGRPLSDLMHQGELNLQRAVGIVIEVASALVEAHARGVVHRDIKPSNIMIDDSGQVKVLDFGLAKQLNKDTGGSAAPEAQTLLSTETRSGVVLGTPAYLSPEQATGGAVDGRSDLFALGTLLYEAVTGRTPFAGNSFIEIAANVLHGEPKPPSKLNSQIPPELDFITLKLLQKKPPKRYQSAKELIADLHAVKDRLEEGSGQTLIRRSTASLTGPSRTLSNLSQILQRPRIPISYILIGVAILLAGAGLAFTLLRTKPHVPPPEAQRWYDIGTAALRDGAFYQASQALQRAISVDDNFMLAHARLAEALVELDYVNQAKDELLRVNATSRASLPKLDALYLDAITAVARQDSARAVELYKQIAKDVSDSEKGFVLVDLGRAYENQNDVKGAIQSYKDASARNSQYATAYLHLGILYGQQGDLDAALQSFEQAESIYQALGNLEGRAEAVFQRGALFNKRNNLSQAKTELEQALNLAKANDNKSQTIKTLLQLSSVAFDAGETARSTEYIQEALQLAQKNGMENLSARGLNDQGNNFLIKGEYAKADEDFSQALQSAQRSKALRNEARARFSLGSLRLRQNNVDEAVRYLEPALAFYQQGGYRSETSLCLLMLARAKRQRGEYEAALSSDAQILQLGEQVNDQSQIALAHSEMANVLVRQEKYPEALEHFGKAFDLYNSQGIQRSIGYNLQARGEVLAQLGRYPEAQTQLDQATAIADKPGAEIKPLSVAIMLVEAQSALSAGRFPEAKTRAEKVREAAGTELKEDATGAQIVIGLAESYNGATAAGKQTLTTAVEMAKQLNDPAKLASAQLALAIASLLAGDSRAAASNALQAEEIFARLGQPASDWQALLIAAQASQNSGDKTKGHEYAMRATETFSKLEQRWGGEAYKTYLSRPDVQRFRKQLEQLNSAQ